MSASLYPDQLPSLLESWPDIKILSLDCFDTLLWRDSYQPVDIFSALPDVTAHQRRFAEAQARKKAQITRSSSEVTLEEIYRELLPHADETVRAAAMGAEQAAEAAHCFGFGPVIASMRQARQAGLTIIIVSDTYFDEEQLRHLIAQAAGPEVAAMIDRIFCSCTLGKPKAGGLYSNVLDHMRCDPGDILHIGDNRVADCDSVASYGVNTLHLQSFPASMCDQLRHESMIGRVANGPCNEDIETPQPHRAVLAMGKTGGADPAQSFGFAALGPLLQGFENWLQAEERILASRFSGTVHRVYLMRDGFLPMKVHRAQHGESAGHAVEISRFTAIAASLGNAESVLAYAAGQGGLRPQTLARQLLFDTKEIARICHGKNDHENWQALWAELRALPVRRAIVRRSRALSDRLIAYLRRMVDPAEGDVLMLIDLGYNGTVQNAIDDLLSDRLGVHVAGRYMILRELDCPGYDKRGFFDRRHFDDMTLGAMCENVAVLEQFCTSGTGSVT
ncbi:MAG: HAD family hydrolase, partial [Sphingomonadaceae bacterium]